MSYENDYESHDSYADNEVYSSGTYEDNDMNNENYSNDENGDAFEDCRFCSAKYKIRNRQRHHDHHHERCDHCSNVIPKTSMDTHIERKHTSRCRYCNEKVLTTELYQHKAIHHEKCKFCKQTVLKRDMNAHIADHHSSDKILGMIRLDKTSDQEINRLIAANRIYAKDGCLFKD